VVLVGRRFTCPRHQFPPRRPAPTGRRPPWTSPAPTWFVRTIADARVQAAVLAPYWGIRELGPQPGGRRSRSPWPNGTRPRN